jgi:16S rRNA C967 or C1407 C5-methylase (RsmB/RsmF family)
MGRKQPGSERFESTYSALYHDRWTPLKEALLKPPCQTGYDNGLLKPYFLDEASLEPPRLLGAEPGMEVLDLCAAPGGKSLVLAKALAGKGNLLLNDMSADRVRRLRQVMKEHLPPDLLSTVSIIQGDGSRMGMKIRDRFDRILLDAPCSSERHVLNSPLHLDEWGPGRIKSLAIRQFALAVSALDMLKPGGIMVYSTCSIHPDENDGVIEKLLKRRAGMIELLENKSPPGEKTSCGSIILPDVSFSRGPIYMAILVKSTAIR